MWIVVRGWRVNGLWLREENGLKEKRYRRPKVVETQIKMQRGKVDGDVDMCIFYGDNVPRCDRALVMNALGFPRLNYKGKADPSLIDELEARGYDLDTLKFSISKL